MTDPIRHPDLFTAAEALEYLHRPDEPALLENLRASKTLKGWKLGKVFMYHREELNALVINGFSHVYIDKKNESRRQPETGPRLRMK